MREKLIDEMENVFAGDRRRIDHALAVLGYAEGIQAEQGGDKRIVVAAAILHDIGIKASERKYASSGARYQEIEGPPIARDILERNGFAENDIDHICRIIANHHSAMDIDTEEFRIVWDADWLVNIPAEHADLDEEQLSELIEKVFKTDAGLAISKKLFLKS